MDLLNLQNNQNNVLTINSLPNDYDVETKFNEKKFIDTHLKEYNIEKINWESETYTILNSRTLQRDYYCEKNLNISDFDNFFKTIGTTLSIDYYKNYVRCASWDVDCLCRKKNVYDHTQESDINRIIKFINEFFKDAMISIWVNTKGCGFHIYTNVSISYPIHLLLTKIFNVQPNLKNYVIEIPRFMPVPCSAKIPKQPYTRFFTNNDDFNLLPSKKFSDCIYYKTNVDQANSENLIGKITTSECNYYLYYTKSCFETEYIPKFKNIKSIDILPDYDYLSKLKHYFERDEFKLNSKTEVYCENLLLNEFIIDYNESFCDDNIKDINWGRFIEHATITYGSLYLQHLVVLCHKYVLSRDFHYDVMKFKNELLEIFSKHHPSIDVIQFLERYDKFTYNNYADETYDDMKKYFQLIFKLNLSDPYISEVEILEKCVNMLSSSQIRTVFKQITKKNFPDKQENVENILNKYIECITMFKFVMKHENTCYTLNSDFYYKPVQNINFPGITTWCGFNSDLKTYCLQYLKTNMPNVQKSLWTEASIIIPTKVGNFNSVTGTYSMKCPFLRYSISRHKMIWKHNHEEKMYKEQNKDVAEIARDLKHYATNMSEYMIKMFIHYSLIPSVLDLENHSYIDSNMFYKFIEKIAEFDDLNDAHFIVEYIPINVEFVHYIMCLMQNYNNDYNILCSYKALVNQNFSFTYSADLKGWEKLVNQSNKDLVYNHNTTSHMELLMSIKSKHVSQPSQRFCFIASIIAYCMYKCPDFKLLKRACGARIIEKTPNALNENYPNITNTTSLKDAQNNMKRAKRLVFGNNLDSLNTSIINLICMVFTSCSFVLENVLEFFNVLSCNNTINSPRKKFLLFKGDQDSGKSRWCELFVSMNEPESASVKHLSEAISRSNITQTCNLVSISEVKCEYDYMIKSITGSDKDCGKTFYKQEISKSKTQSIVIGATNVDIIFKKSGKEYIDKITCERIHAVLMDGKHVADCHDNFAKMFVEKRYYRVEDENSSSTEQVFSALWLSYIWYNQYKDASNLYPINLNNKDAREYQERVYKLNNRVYDTITRLGLIEVNDMHMESYKIRDLLKKNLDEKEFLEFLDIFSRYYKDLFKNKIINNLIESEFYYHLVSNFEVSEEPGACITKEELETRSCIYEDSVQKANALSYFSFKNVKYFNTETEEYLNIKFKQDAEYFKLNVINSNNYSEVGIVESMIK